MQTASVAGSNISCDYATIGPMAEITLVQLNEEGFPRLVRSLLQMTRSSRNEYPQFRLFNFKDSSIRIPPHVHCYASC